MSSYDPSNAIDVSDYNNDIPPTSLSAIFAQGTLVSDIDATSTTLQANITSGNAVVGVRLNVGTGPDAESMWLTGASGNTLTVIRGVAGKQEAHPAGSAVSCTDLIHLNAKGYQIVAGAVQAWSKQTGN